MIVEKAYVGTNRGQLHLRRCGGGRPLVLLQVLPFGSAMFEPVMPFWARLGYQALAFDLMGYGRSDLRDAGSWSIGDHADIVAEALAHLGVSRAAVLGGHFGALVAVDLALRRTPLVSHLVLDGVPAWDEAERARRRALNDDPAPLDLEGQAIVALWRRTVRVLTTADPASKLDPASESRFLEHYAAFLSVAHKPGPAGAFFDYPTIEALQALRVPTLVIGSRTDTLAACHERAVSLIPGARARFFDDGNPLYHLTRPAESPALDAYALTVHEFLAGEDDAPAA